MTLTVQEKIVNSNNKNRKVDNFYTSFFGIPENISNVLGKQVKSISRPTFEIMTSNRRHRSRTHKNPTNVTMTPVTIAFHDDEEAITSMFLYAQLFRQIGKHVDKFGETGTSGNYKFDIKVECFNANNKVTEGFIIRDCFIQNISHSDPILASEEDCEINVTIEFDDIDILVFDTYINMINGEQG